jgi:hypothetical protein
MTITPLLALLLACSEPSAAPCPAALQSPIVTPATSDTGAAPSGDSGGDSRTDTGAACTPDAWYLDCDADGMGRSPTTLEFSAVVACEPDLPAPSDPRCAWVTVAGDCDDTDPATRPFVAEVCDGRDNDCNSYVDEGCQ